MQTTRPEMLGFAVGSTSFVALLLALLPISPEALGTGGGTPARAATSAPAQELDAEAEIAFALDALEERCGHFFELKGIDWGKVRKEFENANEDVETLGDLHYQLTRLLARVHDGHAYVKVLDEGLTLEWPEHARQENHTGPGLFLVQIGKKLFVKESFKTGADVGLKPGAELLKIDGEKPLAWLEERIEQVSDTKSFSSVQHAQFFVLSKGLTDPEGTRLEFQFKLPDSRKKKTATVTYTAKVSAVPNGPAAMPEDIEGSSDLHWAMLPSGHGWIHVRRCPSDLAERVDEALASLGEPRGIVLDFRGCSGGGFDHDALYGRFVPEGETFGTPKSYASAGPNPYAGPVVVIVDGSVASAGETASGMFKEDGRAWMIGDSPTAGMSSGKTTIELPSGQFALYVSISSNKGRFNGGRGIEGIGVPPNEVVEYDPEDLFEGRDTLILRAAELLDDMPKSVPYKPADFGFER